MKFDLHTGPEVLFVGNFQAPDKHWIHMSREIDSYEIFYVTKGVLYIADDNNNYTVNEGQYLITPPCRNQHGWKSSFCEFYYFHFLAEEEGENFPIQGTYNDWDTLEKYYSLLYCGQCSQEVQNHLLAAVLLELKGGGAQRVQQNISQICSSVQAYIKFAPADRLRVTFIADKFKYNEKYLSQSFKRQTGMSLKKHLKNEIISRACHMLVHTDLPVARIGEQLGYCDAHSFSHIFKNASGMSPLEYRKKHKQTGI